MQRTYTQIALWLSTARIAYTSRASFFIRYEEKAFIFTHLLSYPQEKTYLGEKFWIDLGSLRR